MPRNRNKRRVQRSKRARDTLKEARWARMSRRTGHPCHFNGRGHWGRWHWVQPGKRIVLIKDKALSSDK